MQAFFRAPFIALLFLGLASSHAILTAEPKPSYSEHELRFIHDNKAVHSESSSLSITKMLSDAVADGSFFWPLILAAIAGLLTSLSPCVYPLIPITLSVMGTRQYQSHLHGFFTASSYVFGMSLLYTLLGATFAYLGVLAGSLMQNQLVTLFVAMLFFVLALFMFGLLDVVMPTSLLNRLSRVGGQGYGGAFLMGLVAGIIAAPCTGPVLGFILTFIAKNQNITLGVMLMFAFSLGLGLPFLILGTFSSMFSRLPKSGKWMDRVKFFFGAIMLAAAIYYLGMALNPVHEFLQTLGAMGSLKLLLILAASLALLLIKPGAGAPIAALSLAVLLSYDGPKPAENISQDGTHWHVMTAHDAKEGDFSQLMEQARSLGKPVLVDFYADWCISCKQLDTQTFGDSDVKTALEDYFLIRVDATGSSDILNKVQSEHGVTGLPTIIFFDRQGRLQKDTRILGFMAPKAFLIELKKMAERP